jgi:hypothetical protein
MALSSQQIAEKGESIYNARYKAEYEKRHFGQYVAIDIESGQAFVAPRHTGVYHVSYTANANAKPLF